MMLRVGACRPAWNGARYRYYERCKCVRVRMQVMLLGIERAPKTSRERTSRQYGVVLAAEWWRNVSAATTPQTYCMTHGTCTGCSGTVQYCAVPYCTGALNRAPGGALVSGRATVEHWLGLSSGLCLRRRIEHSVLESSTVASLYLIDSIARASLHNCTQRKCLKRS